ncbi:MAG: hypothetical protein AVDCRST_MAG49-3463 [uncultured Thermomicrobiales bacterium]|uniref:Uncharacterized protein n=1 Tax=uncultured Thermomicrobiales bacterium TaxID=1645740 RepID=A0A6J4V5F7_9BACT|nr:MAG: hypothetical protein AVDCRST_MAG49-3463 [uncultured Thermomicrobiales bacterium]
MPAATHVPESRGGTDGEDAGRGSRRRFPALAGPADPQATG